MVLTRPLFILVKGAHAAHAATMCKLEGYACLTEAHAAIEASVMSDICKEMARRKSTDERHSNCIACAAASQCRTMTSIQSIFDIARTASLSPPVSLAVNVMLCAAVLHTGFSDAGAKFRDRTARQEAARHYGDSIIAVLTTPLLPL